MFKNLKLGVRLGLGFSAILVLLACMGSWGIFNNSRTDKALKDLVEEFPTYKSSRQI